MNRKLIFALLAAPSITQAAIELEYELAIGNEITAGSAIVQNGERIVRVHSQTGMNFDGCVSAKGDCYELDLEIFTMQGEEKVIHAHSTIRANWDEQGTIKCAHTNQDGEPAFVLKVRATRLEEGPARKDEWIGQQEPVVEQTEEKAEQASQVSEQESATQE